MRYFKNHMNEMDVLYIVLNKFNALSKLHI